MEKSLVSVIVPAYNAEKYLTDAIECILAQNHRPLEIIVVDDGSTDETAYIAQKYPEVRYVYQENMGIASALNTGFKLAEGEFFAQLDSDNLWMPHKLELQLQAFDNDPDLDVVFGHAKQFISPDVEKGSRTLPSDLEVLPGLTTNTMLIRREAFWRVGLLDTGYTVGEFIGWYMQAKAIGLKELMLPEIVLRRRIHDANTGILKRDARQDYVRALKEALDRRRRDQARADEE